MVVLSSSRLSVFYFRINLTSISVFFFLAASGTIYRDILLLRLCYQSSTCGMEFAEPTLSFICVLFAVACYVVSIGIISAQFID